MLLHRHSLVGEASSLMIYVGVLPSGSIGITCISVGLIIASTLVVIVIWHQRLSIEVLAAVVRGAIVRDRIVVGHARWGAILKGLRRSRCYSLALGGDSTCRSHRAACGRRWHGRCYLTVR